MKENGISSIELMIVMSVIGIFTVALGVDYYGWVKMFTEEKIIKELYTDMMLARMLAVTRGLEHYVALSKNEYSVFEDTNDSGKKDTGDMMLPEFPKKVKASLIWNNSGNEVTFDKRGIMPKWRTIRIDSSSADYNCIAVSETRIIMGQYRDNKCKPK